MKQGHLESKKFEIMNASTCKDLKEIEKTMVVMARSAGVLLSKRFRQGVQPEFKDEGKKRDPVTEADRESQDYLRQQIELKFPSHAILGEEKLDQGGDNPEWVWILDPLDGTINFMRGFEIYGVSIGLLHYGQPVAGAIFLAGGENGLGRVYHARTGGGTYRDGVSISVAKEERLDPTHLVCLPGNYWKIFEMQGHLKKRFGEWRGSGSIANDIALTAEGVFHCALFAAPKIWDVAAGVLLVQEAGGEALVRRPRGMKWYPLERFGRDPLSPPSSLRELREWKGTVMVGNKAIARFISDNLRRPLRGASKSKQSGQSTYKRKSRG